MGSPRKSREMGLAIEAEYPPAQEVGGDFFQVLPSPADGSVLIVLGDVTGKGLQAAMLVALIVGAIRSQAEISPDPEAMLEALARSLCGSGHGHATCLALRVDRDGSATLANAGHLPPYCNGADVEIPGSLPLGILLSAEYEKHRFHLRPGDQWMLMSESPQCPEGTLRFRSRSRAERRVRRHHRQGGSDLRSTGRHYRPDAALSASRPPMIPADTSPLTLSDNTRPNRSLREMPVPDLDENRRCIALSPPQVAPFRNPRPWN